MARGLRLTHTEATVGEVIGVAPSLAGLLAITLILCLLSMDIHPSGFPGLVGPEGGDFSQFDFSSQFRVLPSNGAADIPSPSHENLGMRSHLQSFHLQASPSNNTMAPRLSQPLRICDENGRNHSSGNGGKAGSPRPLHLLSDRTVPLLGFSPNKRLAHSLSSPARVSPSEEVKEDEVELPVSSGFDQNGDPLVFGS